MDPSSPYRIDEIEVRLEIDAGKIVAESNSGATEGELTLEEDDRSIRLVLEGAGRDRGSATLTIPEVSRLRTHLDDILSGESPTDATSPSRGEERDGVVFSGTSTLRELDGTIAMSLEPEALHELGLVDEDGTPVDEERQLEYTVFRSGVIVVDARTGPRDFEF